MRLAVAWLVLIGCGRVGFDPIDDGPLPPSDGTVSGSRLRARDWIAEDGSRAFETLYDTVLATPCNFQPAIDGTSRCIPSQASANRAFADPSCTTPAAYAISETCDPVSFAYDEGTERVYRLGASLAQGYIRFGTLCMEMAGLSFFARQEELPPDAMVAATLQHIAGARIGHDEWLADDGARLFAGGLRDNALAMSCTLEGDVDQPDPLCAPTTVSRFFTDAACTQAVYGPFVNPPADGTPLTLPSLGDPGPSSLVPSPCTPPPYRQVIHATLYTNLYTSNIGTCVPANVPSGWFVEDGGEVPRSSFAAGHFEQWGGRITTPIWHGDDGALIPLLGTIWDRQLASPCIPRADTAGVTRCHAVRGRTVVAWIDPACTMSTPVTVTCDGSPAWTGSEPGGSSCTGPEVAIFESDTPIEIFTQESGACSPVLAAPATAWLAGLQATDPATFTALTGALR